MGENEYGTGFCGCCWGGGSAVAAGGLREGTPGTSKCSPFRLTETAAKLMFNRNRWILLLRIPLLGPLSHMTVHHFHGSKELVKSEREIVFESLTDDENLSQKQCRIDLPKCCMYKIIQE